MDTQKICTGCQKPLPPTAPQGLCPECLMKAALGTGVDVGPETQAGRPKVPFTPPSLAELSGHFPQLEILEFIAQGGMGAVYKARQKQLDRVVALKILPPQAVSGPGFAERFTREARALAKLNHPHIVTLYEFGQSDGLFYFLMEFVDGVNLQQLLLGGRIAPNEALAIVPQICDALQFAHQRGIVHRDIKPGNILLSKEGQVKIADFGVAKIMVDTVDAHATETPGATTGELTEAGSVLGTPQYMAPEQVAQPLSVDHRADIYSLGVVFYQMLTGELPAGKFEAPSKKVMIDVRLDEVVLRALEKKPELRYQQAGEVRTRLETIAATQATVTSPSPSEIGPSMDLTGLRWSTILWALALASGGLGMALNVVPKAAGIAIGMVGVGLSAAAILLTSFFQKNPRLASVAKRYLSLNGVCMASAAMWAASTPPSVYPPCRHAIDLACLGAIVYCLRCLAGIEASATTAQNPRSLAHKLLQRSRRTLRFRLPVVIIIVVVIRTFFVQLFRADTDAASPEIPRGSCFMVWKPTHTFVPGDMIAYHFKEWINVGRVARIDYDTVWVNKNGQPTCEVPANAIIGKVISVYWRASADTSPVGFLRPSNGGLQHFTGSDSKIEASAMRLGTLMNYAYGMPRLYVHWSENRVILPPGVPDDKFDLLLMHSDPPQEALQAEIKAQLGLMAHHEKFETNVLDLVVANPNLISQAVAEDGNGADGSEAPGRFKFANMPIDDLGDFLEKTLGEPVINETELTQKFSGILSWTPQPDPAANLKEIQKALADQFGLDLVPGHEPVEMLVVEKVK